MDGNQLFPLLKVLVREPEGSIIVLLKGCGHCGGDILNDSCLQCARSPKVEGPDPDIVAEAHAEFLGLIWAKDDADFRSRYSSFTARLSNMGR